MTTDTPTRPPVRNAKVMLRCAHCGFTTTMPPVLAHCPGCQAVGMFAMLPLCMILKRSALSAATAQADADAEGQQTNK